MVGHRLIGIGGIVQAPVDARNALQSRASLFQSLGRLAVAGQLELLQHEQRGDELDVVGDPVLQLLEHRRLDVVEVADHLLLGAQPGTGRVHVVDQYDVDADDDHIEGQRQGALRADVEGPARRNEEIPGGQAGQHGAQGAGAAAAEEGGQDDGGKEGQVGEALQQDVHQGEACRQG